MIVYDIAFPIILRKDHVEDRVISVVCVCLIVYSYPLRIWYKCSANLVHCRAALRALLSLHPKCRNIPVEKKDIDKSSIHICDNVV